MRAVLGESGEQPVREGVPAGGIPFPDVGSQERRREAGERVAHRLVVEPRDAAERGMDGTQQRQQEGARLSVGRAPMAAAVGFERLPAVAGCLGEAEVREQPLHPFGRRLGVGERSERGDEASVDKVEAVDPQRAAEALGVVVAGLPVVCR